MTSVCTSMAIEYEKLDDNPKTETFWSDVPKIGHRLIK